MKHVFTGFSNHRVPLVLLAELLIVTGVWGFLALASKVSQGDTRQLDELVMNALRQPGNPAVVRGPLWMLQVAKDITALGSYTVLTFIVAAVMGLLALQRRYRTSLLILLTTCGGVILSGLLKMHYGRARPDVSHLVDVFSSSFPSGHAMASAIVYLTLGTLLSRVEPSRTIKIYLLGLAMFLSFMVGLSRIYLGVHYPSDVLAGWTAGLVWALFCWSLSQFFTP